jgi:hypothetical protein
MQNSLMGIILVTFLIALAAMLAMGSDCRAQTQQEGASAESSETEIATLVEQLADPNMAVRVAAERVLRQRGPAVLAELPDPKTLSVAAADVVRRLRADLQREQAAAALAPGRVTLQGEMSLTDVLEAIGKQTGNAVDHSELSAETRRQRIRVDLEHSPFWEAIGIIEQRAGLVASCDEQRDVVQLRATADREVRPLATANEGPFRISVLRVAEQIDFVDPDRRLLRTAMEVLVEPRLRPLFLHVADAEIQVVGTCDAHSDSQDPPEEPLPPLSPAAKREMPIDRPGPIRVTHDVILPQGNLTPPLEAIDLRGRFEMELAAGQEQFEFRHLDEAGRITRHHGGVRVTLESLKHDDGVVDLQLQLRYDADGPSFDSYRSWVFHNEAWLTTGGGSRLEPTEFETLAEGEGGARLRYRFAGVDKIDAQSQFTYTAPTLFTRVPIEFSLKAVPANR